jgi:hypothetical protein
VIIVIDRDRFFAPPAPPPAASADASPESIDDPIAPGQPMRLAGVRGSGDGIRGQANGGAWVTARPEARFRAEKTIEARGGVDPCDAPDPGFAGFSRWKPLGGGALHLVPEKGGIDAEGRFDLMLEFHGHDLARKGFVAAAAPIVLGAMSSATGYRSRFAGPDGLDHLVLAVEVALSEGREPPAKARRVALAAWSGGYEAVAALLEHDADRVDSVVLLDGLHASRTPETMELQLAPFVAFAKRAARGETFMMVTHSSVDTDQFASTTETARWLIRALGGAPLEVRRDDPLGLELVYAFSQGNFHVRGYAGGEKPDHCAQLALMKDATLAIARRWKLR